MTLPALVITPHSSGFVPLDVLAQMLGERVHSAADRDARLRWIFDEGDPYTDLIFHTAEAPALHATVSRFVVDLNRARDEGGDNGVIKLTDFEGRPLYPGSFRLPPEARERRLRRYWDAFHAEIEAELASGVRLLVNGHSMQPHGPVIGPDRGRPRPALTLMTGGDERGEARSGRTHSSVSGAQARALIEALERRFGDLVRSSAAVPPRIALNDPWSVDTLTHRYSDPGRPSAVAGFGLEVNRALYLRYEDGQEFPNEPVIRALNEAFGDFLRDAVEIVSPRP